MATPHDSELMQRADGELDEAATEAIDAHALRDPVVRGKLEAVGQLGEAVRGNLELAAEAVPDGKFAAMWSQVEKSLDHSLGHAREPGETPRVVPIGFGKRLSQWFDRYRGHVLTGVVSAGAVAALALVLRPSGRDTTDSSGHMIDVRPVVHRPSEIESLDTPAGNGTVLNLQDEDGNTTVIWVTPEDTVEGI